MGVHEAYHQDRRNRLVHWVCIPLELLAVAALLAAIPAGPFRDGALIATAALVPIYVATEPLLGALMIGFLLACRAVALVAIETSLVGTLVGGVLLFAVTFALQLRIGHGVFEAGRDDTEMNLGELRRTKNPIPILLVFYYHLVELALAAGYRPSLRETIAGFTREHLAAAHGQPGIDRVS
jgi:uncharacterized membrane protein YGL010W